MSGGPTPHDTGQQSPTTTAARVARHGSRPAPVCEADRKPIGSTADAAVPRDPRRRRNAAMVITDPHIVVAESATVADPAALDDALELFVRWAVRAHGRWHPVEAKAQTPEASRAQSEGAISEAEAPVAHTDGPDATRAQAPDAQGDAPSDEDSTTYRPGEMT